MKFRPSILATMALAAMLTHPATAASIYWSGNGTVLQYSWTDVTNWSTSLSSDTPNPLAAPGAGDTAIFNTTTASSLGSQYISLDANQSVLGLQVLNGDGADIDGLGVYNLTVGNGGISVVGTGVLTLASDVILGTGGITVATGGSATLTGNAILNGNQTWTGDQTAANLSFSNITGTGNLTLSGNFNPSIQSGTANFNGSLTIAGSTEWYSSFLNGASGGVITSMGTLGIHSDPVTGVFELDHGLVLSGGNTNMYTNGAPVVLAGPVTGQLSVVNFVTTNSLTLSGTANNALNLTTPAGVVTYLAKTSSSNVHAVGTNLSVSNGSTIMITGTGGDQIQDSIDVTMNASSTFDLNGHSEAVDGLIGGNATAMVTNSAAATTSTLTLGAGNGSNSFNGVIQNGAGTINLRKTGTGTLTLFGANTYTGTTTVNRGTLFVDYGAVGAAASILNSASNLVLGGGTFSVRGSATAASSQILNGVTLNGGASGLSVNANGGLGTVLNVGAITQNSGSTLNFTLPAGAQSATNGILTTTANSGSTILGGWATANGTDWAVSSGGNINPLGSYTPDTWAAGNDVNVTTSSSPTSGSIANSLRFGSAGANTVTLAGTNVISTGGVLVNSTVGNNVSTITGGAITSGSGEVYLQQFNTANTLNVSSALVNNGGTATNVTKSGSGTLNLSGVNTFTGSFNVNNGVVNPTGTNATMGAVNVNGGGTLNISGSAAMTSSAPVNLANGGTINVDSSSTLGNGSNAVTLSGTSTLNFNNGGLVTLPTAAVSYQSSSNWPNTPNFLGNVTGDNSYQVGANGGAPNTAQPDFVLIDLGSNISLSQLQVIFSNSYRNLQFYTANSSVGSFSSLFTANGNSAASPSTLNLGLFTPDSVDFNTGNTDAPTGAATFALNAVSGEYLAIYMTNRVGNEYGFDIRNLQLTSLAGPTTQSIGSLSGTSGASTVNLATNLTLSVGSNNTSTSYAGTVIGGGALSKTGTGVLTLTNGNTYVGGTTVLQGTVKVMNSTGSATGTGSVLVSGGTLAGNGLISGPVTLSSGKITAGDAGVGTLTLGSLTWNGGTAQLSFNLDLADNGSTVLTLNGAFTKGTAGTFDIDFGGTGAGGFTYTLVNFGSTNFNVSDISLSGFAPGVSGTLQLNGTTLTLTTVPEPGTLPLLGLALGGFIVFQLRRARRA